MHLTTNDARTACSKRRLNGPIRILVFMEFYLPGFRSGGPVRSLANIVDRLGPDFEFWIVTSDRDAYQDRAYQGVGINQWNDVAGAKVYYCARENISFEHFRRLMCSTDHDVLYVNSFFSPTFTLLPLLVGYLAPKRRKPVIVAPRGEFSPGALKLKQLRKAVYLLCVRALRLYSRAIWHASTEFEAAEIECRIGASRGRIVIARNLTSAPSLFGDSPAAPARSEELRVIFLSRVSPKKNLHFALEALRLAGVPASLSIVGSIGDENYWEECQRKIGALPRNVRVTYQGEIPHQEVGRLLATYDLFLLPTLGENYGHAILESLASGTPVLISDQTPWKDLEQVGVGWVKSLADPQAFARVIQHVAGRSETESLEQRARAVAYARSVLEDESVLCANRYLFESAFMNGEAT